MWTQETREGEVTAAVDPSREADDARLIFVGYIETPWRDPATCPKNLTQARERGGGATLCLEQAWREGLRGLEPGADIIVLYWMNRARRDLIVQHPSHRKEPSGVFLLRSPLRPNPIAFSVVRVTDAAVTEGRIGIDAIDCLDGTPLLDLKPYYDSVDRPPQIAK